MSPTYCVCCSSQTLPENHLQKTPTYSLQSERKRERDGERQVVREENEIGEKPHLNLAATKGYRQLIKGAHR